MTMGQKLSVPLEKFLAAGVHVGLKYRTRYLKDFIYKIRPDGLCVLNVQKIAERIRVVGKFLAQYEPEDILVVCRRDSGHSAVKEFARATGVKYFIGRYLPGTMTNMSYEFHFEPKVLLVCDPWPDLNAMKEAFKINIPVLALVDSNNTTNNIDLFVPCNNKGRKSLGLIFYVLAKEYLKNKGKLEGGEDLKIPLENFFRVVRGKYERPRTRGEGRDRGRGRGGKGKKKRS